MNRSFWAWIMCLVILLIPTVSLAAEIDQDVLIQSGEIITKASSSIAVSSSTITGTAITYANKTCSKLGALFELQKWTGSGWTTVKSASLYLSSVISSTVRVSFNAGSGTYRIKATHRAYDGNVIRSSRVTYTPSVVSPS